MHKEFCVYLTTYMGDKLPPFYIGSTSIKRIEAGYRGSVCSKKYKQIWEKELNENPQLFKYQILAELETRKNALIEELYWQLQFDVVKSHDFINMSFASINGFYGMDTSGKNNPMYGNKCLSGENNPMYGKHHSASTKEKIKKNQNMQNVGPINRLLKSKLTDEQILELIHIKDDLKYLPKDIVSYFFDNYKINLAKSTISTIYHRNKLILSGTKPKSRLKFTLDMINDIVTLKEIKIIEHKNNSTSLGKTEIANIIHDTEIANTINIKFSINMKPKSVSIIYKKFNRRVGIC